MNVHIKLVTPVDKMILVEYSEVDHVCLLDGELIVFFKRKPWQDPIRTNWEKQKFPIANVAFFTTKDDDV
jgi:hypothetical protein